MADPSDPGSPEGSRWPPEGPPSLARRLRHLIFGAPRSLADRRLFHHLSLVAFLAWVGLGADGLSSSSYGPEEAFRTLGTHTYLAVALAALTAGTVFLIAAAYSRIIEEFPHGGGGYVVATKLLGDRAGLVSGSALIVDYVLTIAVSIASAGDALFSFLPPAWLPYKLGVAAAFIVVLTLLNIRGVKESVLALLPIFILFLVTHVIVIGGGILAHADQLPALAGGMQSDFHAGASAIGLGGLVLILLHAYSMGGGTYTGLEAVSNGLPIMREPRVRTGKRTMALMAVSLAITASGLILCYLLWQVSYVHGKTMNAVLLERMTAGFVGGAVFVIVTLISEGALLVVGAQAGFIDGPRVLANMAVDSWMPRRFAALSDRLTTQNGILLMGGSALLILLYARGDVRHLVVMYSINVFLTFSLSMLAMLRHSLAGRKRQAHWRRRTALFLAGLILCVTILAITVLMKFREGGWLTIFITGALVASALLVRIHYRRVGAKLAKLYAALDDIPLHPGEAPAKVDPRRPTAAVLVASYGGLGIHTVLNLLRSFPGQFENLVFVSAGEIDSGSFKGEGSIEALTERTEGELRKYVELGRGLGLAATYRLAIGMDAVEELEKLCWGVVKEFPRVIFFAGKVVFKQEGWYHRLLHNETALAVQRRLMVGEQTMVVVPARLD